MLKCSFCSLLVTYKKSLTLLRCKRGFTIIELLVVVSIIGILAAISIVTYNGVREKADATSLQSDLQNTSDQLVIDQAKSSDGTFPQTLDDASSPIKWSGNTTAVYTVNNTGTPKTFCLTATKSSKSYFITQEGLPMPGPCPVLYLDASIPTSYPESGTTWYDLSGNGYFGTTVITGGIPTQFPYSTESGGTLAFNGTNRYVVVQSTPDLNFSTNGTFSISVWIKPDTLASGWIRSIIVQENYLASGYRFGILNGGRPIFWTTQSGGTLSMHPASQSLTVNQWANIVVTYSNQQAYMYINGEQAASSTGTYIAGSNNVYPGLIVQEYYSGLMGSVMMYNSSLSSSVIQEIFQSTRSRYGI